MTPERYEELEKRQEELKSKVDEVKDESKAYTKIVNKLVQDYSEDLDWFIEDLERVLQGIKRGKIKTYSELKLEQKCLFLAQSMYKAADGLAVLGGQTDVAKIQREDAFNRAYQKTKDGTIPDKKAEAEERIVTEKMIEKIFDRAYKALSIKVKSGNRVLEAIKKILTSRMIHKEVFRKEATVMDQLNPDELTEGDLDYEGDEGDDI